MLAWGTTAVGRPMRWCTRGVIPPRLSAILFLFPKIGTLVRSMAGLGDPTEPLARALALLGAMRVDAGDFPTLDANSGLLRRLVGRGFQVWSLPGRKARDGNGRRGWRLGVRLGLTALGELPRRICDPAPTPPGVRRAGRRDAMAVILCKVQVGYRPSVVAGAQLGFPVMAYQSAELLIGQREDSGRILVRIESTCSRARMSEKNAETAQRAKVGYCPCCTRPTHIAAPSRYVVGEFAPSNHRGNSLWMEHGPRAVRYFAAPLYAQDCGYFPPASDWAARPLNARAPPLFDGAFGSAHGRGPSVSRPIHTMGDREVFQIEGAFIRERYPPGWRFIAPASPCRAELMLALPKSPV